MSDYDSSTLKIKITSVIENYDGSTSEGPTTHVNNRIESKEAELDVRETTLQLVDSLHKRRNFDGFLTALEEAYGDPKSPKEVHYTVEIEILKDSGKDYSHSEEIISSVPSEWL